MATEKRFQIVLAHYNDERTYYPVCADADAALAEAYAEWDAEFNTDRYIPTITPRVISLKEMKA